MSNIKRVVPKMAQNKEENVIDINLEEFKPQEEPELVDTTELDDEIEQNPVEEESEVVINAFEPEMPIKAQPNVRVKPRESFECYIGNKWYYFKKGVQQPVPQNVKERLLTQGRLDPL